jgi:hypothetical protein
MAQWRSAVTPVSDELKELARVLIDWAAPAQGITLVVFSSRVRGDYNPDSDVDVCFRWGDKLWDADTRMVEKHYGHLAPSFIADAIRAGAPRFGETTSERVVPLR